MISGFNIRQNNVRKLTMYFDLFFLNQNCFFIKKNLKNLVKLLCNLKDKSKHKHGWMVVYLIIIYTFLIINKTLKKIPSITLTAIDTRR